MNLKLHGSRYCNVFICLLMVILACEANGQAAAPVPSNTSAGTPNVNPSSQVNGTPVSSQEPGVMAKVDQPHYMVSTGDVLDITVFGIPELSQKRRVSSAGDIDFPLINSVHVSGMYIESAQAKIEQALISGNFLKHPHVNLSVSEYGSGVELMGEVARPGIYPVLGSRRLFDLLSAAGGTTPTAGRQVTIVHRADGSQRTVFLSNDPDKAMEADVLVYQSDTIFISRAGVIYVVGEVLQPNGFAMENKTEYTVLRALAMAHGPTKFAKLSEAKIVRKTPNGIKEITAPLDKIEQAKVPDIPLQAEDIVYLPTNKGKVVASRTADVAISLASGMAIIAATRF